MNYEKNDLIRYRLEKSSITFKEAKSLIENGFWNGAANRLYYSCFYSVIALLAKDDISATTHNGVRTAFFKSYIKTGILNKELSGLYTDLMEKRHESDYDDFNSFTKDDILPLLEEVANFNRKIIELINSI
jgi:uncharacterized protein (UPF0332 family)